MFELFSLKSDTVKTTNENKSIFFLILGYKYKESEDDGYLPELTEEASRATYEWMRMHYFLGNTGESPTL